MTVVGHEALRSQNHPESQSLEAVFERLKDINKQLITQKNEVAVVNTSSVQDIPDIDTFGHFETLMEISFDRDIGCDNWNGDLMLQRGIMNTAQLLMGVCRKELIMISEQVGLGYMYRVEEPTLCATILVCFIMQCTIQYQVTQYPSAKSTFEVDRTFQLTTQIACYLGDRKPEYYAVLGDVLIGLMDGSSLWDFESPQSTECILPIAIRHVTAGSKIDEPPSSPSSWRHLRLEAGSAPFRRKGYWSRRDHHHMSDILLQIFALVAHAAIATLGRRGAYGSVLDFLSNASMRLRMESGHDTPYCFALAVQEMMLCIARYSYSRGVFIEDGHHHHIGLPAGAVMKRRMTFQTFEKLLQQRLSTSRPEGAHHLGRSFAITSVFEGDFTLPATCGVLLMRQLRELPQVLSRDEVCRLLMPCVMGMLSDEDSIRPDQALDAFVTFVDYVMGPDPGHVPSKLIGQTIDALRYLPVLDGDDAESLPRSMRTVSAHGAASMPPRLQDMHVALTDGTNIWHMLLGVLSALGRLGRAESATLLVRATRGIYRLLLCVEPRSRLLLCHALYEENRVFQGLFISLVQHTVQESSRVTRACLHQEQKEQSWQVSHSSWDVDANANANEVDEFLLSTAAIACFPLVLEISIFSIFWVHFNVDCAHFDDTVPGFSLDVLQGPGDVGKIFKECCILIRVVAINLGYWTNEQKYSSCYLLAFRTAKVLHHVLLPVLERFATKLEKRCEEKGEESDEDHRSRQNFIWYVEEAAAAVRDLHTDKYT